MNTYEIVVEGRLSETLVRGTGTELIECRDGMSRLLARNFDQLRLHTLFELFRDLNIRLVAVNEAESDLVG